MDRAGIRFIRWPDFFIPVLITAWLLIPVWQSSAGVHASLLNSDAAALEDCLNKIASATALPGDITTCNTILSQPNPPADWTEFFQGYFADHVFNQNLWDYITGPVFWGYGNEASLQTGLIPVMEGLIQQTVTAHPADLGPALAGSANLRDTLLNAHRIFSNVAHADKVSADDRQGIFTFYIDHINTFPQYWKKSTTIDSAAQPHVAALSAQIHSTLRDLLPLSTATKNTIAQTLDLQGHYLDIWSEFSVLLYDNNGFDAAQRAFIYRFFTLNPKELVVVTGISQMEMLGNGGSTHLPILLAGVNVFGNRVGEASENAFPPDGVNHSCDLFGTVVAHEDYHAVFANYVSKQPELMARHNQLIQQAGRDPANYLRGGSEGFFYDNPQEFLASLANQWFCSSADMVQLGIDRYLRGNAHGINQALFFAELISLGSNQTWLYINDAQGNLLRQPAAITRSSLGMIDSIALPGITYRFEVNQDAMVTRLWVDGANLEVEPEAGLTHTYKPGESGDLQFTLRNTGRVPLRIWMEPKPEGMTVKRGALQLDGRSGVSANHNNALNITQKLTLEGWVYPLTWENPPFSNGRILQKGYSDNQYRLLKEGDALVFDVANVGVLRVSNPLPPLNRWTHVAGVYDGKSLRLYVNGDIVGQQTAAGQIGTTTDPLIIGNKAIGGSDGFVGYLDNVRVWSVGRTQSQIKAGMVNDVGGQNGLVSDWRFNTPGSGPVEDSGPSLNAGSLGGNARISAPDGPNGLTARLNWWAGALAAGQNQVVTLHVDTSGAPEKIYAIPYQIRASGMSEALTYTVNLEVSSSPTITQTPTPTPTQPVHTRTPTPTQKPLPQIIRLIYIPWTTH